MSNHRDLLSLNDTDDYAGRRKPATEVTPEKRLNRKPISSVSDNHDCNYIISHTTLLWNQ